MPYCRPIAGHAGPERLNEGPRLHHALRKSDAEYAAMSAHCREEEYLLLFLLLMEEELHGIVLCLHLPLTSSIVSIGVDLEQWRVGPQFLGVSKIPMGLHLLQCGVTEPRASMPERQQSFFLHFLLFSLSPFSNLF